MQRIKLIALLVFQLAALAYYGWLRVHNARGVHEPRSFGDTGEYLHDAGLPITSLEFWTDARPPVTALFWKLVAAEPRAIFKLQLYFSIACWAILAFVVSKVLTAYPLKPIAFALVLAFSLSRDVYMWDPFLGSESVAFSLMALFLAAAVALLASGQRRTAWVLVILASLLVLTRDTFGYLLLMLAPIVVVVFWKSVHRRAVIVIALAFVCIFGLSSQLARLGLRPYRALLMNTSLRIYPSQVYTDYFRQHGMPVDDRLVVMSRNIQPGQKFAVNIALTFDLDQQRFRDWALGPGPAAYIRFLWFFKADALQDVFTETPSQSFYPDVYYYTATGYTPIIEDDRLSELLYPTRFGLLFLFATNLAAAFLLPIAWARRERMWFAPLAMILLTYPQAVLVWAADVNDVARHSVAHNILLRLGTWLLLLFVWDTFWTALSALPARFKRQATPDSTIA